MYFLKHAISSETDGFWLIANYGSSCPSPRPATERARRMLVKSPRGFCVELLAGVRQHFRTTHQEDGGNDRTGEDQSDQVVERVIEGPSCPRHGCRSGSVSRSVPIPGRSVLFAWKFCAEPAYYLSDAETGTRAKARVLKRNSSDKMHASNRIKLREQ